jgi:hypothetical protein
MSLDFGMLDDLLRTSGPSMSGPADAGFDYSIFDNYGTDDDPLYGFDLDDLLRTSSSSEEDDLLELFGFGEDERSNADILDFLAGAKENDYNPTFMDRVGGALSQFFPERKGSGGAGGLLELLGPLALTSFLKDRGVFKPDIAPVGYQGKIPEYTAIREQVTGRDDTDRRPGSSGRRYFSDTIYAKKPEGQEPMTVEEARAKAKAQASGFANGGRVLEDGGYLQGDSDGQADLVPGDIDGVQEARLSHGEYVLPADLVAILGNGNSDAGAAALDDFMSTVRKKATGTPKQQKNIDADQVLAMLSKRMS